MTTRRRLALATALILLAGLAVFWLLARETPIPNRNPTGEIFPSVTGQSLEQQTVRIPADFAGRPAVFLIGYKQDAQFDIDRWLLGLLQAKVDAQLAELPTIPALVPTLISETIDEGMRGGIPKEDWGAVVTLYGDAAKPVAELTGTERGQVARVVLLDGEGKIVWFDDTGYSPRKALEVAELVAGMEAGGAVTSPDPPSTQ